jgi:hypothetical protein
MMVVDIEKSRTIMAVKGLLHRVGVAHDEVMKQILGDDEGRVVAVR